MVWNGNFSRKGSILKWRIFHMHAIYECHGLSWWLYLNVAIHNLPHFRVSSKHVAGSISQGVIWLSCCAAVQNVAPKFLGCNRGTISIEHIGKKLQARSSGTSFLSNTALAQTHRSSSIASSWLNFLERKNNSKKLSQLRHVELANECERSKTNT